VRPRPPLPAGHTAPGSIATDLTVADGQPFRRYWLHVPAGYQPARPTPVLVYFPGHGGTAAAAARDSGFTALADRQDFLAVYPQGLSYDGSPDWADVGRIDFGVDDTWFVSDLLNDLQRAYCVDPNRIYAVGVSAGGGMTKYLACTLAGRIAAFAAVAPDLYQPPGGCHPSRPVSVLEIHGTDDPIVPYAGNTSPDNWPLPAVADWLAGLARADSCPTPAHTFLQAPAITGEDWTGCRDGADIVHYRINGGGHSWPPTIDGAPTDLVIWRFLQTHPLHH
jgi:polyhydroxybutyrate depolymerase